ncbi:MAG: peptidase family protein [Herbinix sp.]|jgi:endoglucanase|nr:peptidase family protein [Herbinix sp.]
MMDMQMMQNVIDAYGPSGREQTASDIIKSYVAPYCDEVYNDVLGNLIAVKHGTSGKKIMLSAHMDQIGLIVVDIDEKGFLYVAPVGGISTILSVAHEVAFQNGTRGVVSYENKTKKLTEISIMDLFIDIGVSTKEEAEAKVSVGDIAIFVSNFVEMGKKVAHRTMDDRISCAVLVEAMKTMKSEHDIYAVFTVQEELGTRGAGPAAYAIEPDLNISLDVCSVGDTPESVREHVKLGYGPTVKAKDASVIVPVSVREFIKKAAQKHAIPVQDEVLRFGGTDTGVVQRTRGGILSGCISIPCRYIHTPVETVDMDDVNAAVKLVIACCEEKVLP